MSNGRRQPAGLAFGVGAAVGSLLVLVALAGLDPTATAEPSGPVGMDIATGTHVFPYRGTIFRDGEALEGTVSLGVTLTAAGETYSETHLDVSVYAGEFQVLVGSAGAGLGEWVFTNTGVTLSLSVDGTALGGSQTIYPAPRAIHRLERDNIDFDGRVRMGSRAAWQPNTIEWPHAHADLQLALSRGAGWTNPVGIGRASSNRLVFDATRHRFWAADGDNPVLEIGAAGTLFATPLSTTGNVTVEGFEMTAPGSTFRFSNVYFTRDGSGFGGVLLDNDRGLGRPRVLNGDVLDFYAIGGDEVVSTLSTFGGVRVQRLRSGALSVDRAQHDAYLYGAGCPDGGVALGFRRESSLSSPMNQLHCSAQEVF